MSETFSADEVPFLQTGRPRWNILFRLGATSGPLRLWNGVGDLAIPADNIETDGATYSGMGQIVGLPAISALVNGLAERVNFTLSGVPPELIALVDAEAANVRFAVVNLGIVLFDDKWQIASTVKWLWQGECDAPMLSSQPAPGNLGGDVIQAISISVGTNNTGRTRPQQSYVTNADQQARSATDVAMSRVVKYNAGATRKWPNY